jgi:hypothetical protein
MSHPIASEVVRSAGVDDRGRPLCLAARFGSEWDALTDNQRSAVALDFASKYGDEPDADDARAYRWYLGDLALAWHADNLLKAARFGPTSRVLQTIRAMGTVPGLTLAMQVQCCGLHSMWLGVAQDGHVWTVDARDYGNLGTDALAVHTPGLCPECGGAPHA